MPTELDVSANVPNFAVTFSTDAENKVRNRFKFFALIGLNILQDTMNF